MSRPGHLLALLAGLCVGELGCTTSEYFVTSLSTTSGTDTAGPDPCVNGLQEPWESDVDCGGPICEPCGVDEACKVDSDCDTALCAEGLCSGNFCELPSPCPVVTAPCLTMSCDPELGCLLEPIPNGDPCGSDPATEPAPPAPGFCLDGLCVEPCACAPQDGPCHESVCGPISNECLVRWLEDDTPCITEDGEGRCFQGHCENLPPKGNVLFFADFEDPNQLFELSEPWEIGDAIPSLCSTQGIEDPETDLGRGALAGLRIGDCLPATPFPKSCLATPPIELPFPATLNLSFWEVADLPPQVTRGTIELVADGIVMEIYETAPATPEWTNHIIPLDPQNAALLQLRFCFEASEALDPYSGWSLDNIEVICSDCF